MFPFSSWIRRPSPSCIPGRRVFAIGDIHGCDDLLERMIAAIRDLCLDDAERPLLVFLGDYVDRGPASKGVLDRLTSLDFCDARFLCGNHEEAMLNFLNDPEEGIAWIRYGGRATMTSYGIELPPRNSPFSQWKQAHADFRAAVPEDHMRFLWSLEDRIALGDYLFVHAGVDPKLPLDRQRPHDLRWIRDPFLTHKGRLGKVIVHGHTPEDRPYVDSRRIGLDTGAYKSGVLTALEVEGRERHFLQVSNAETEAAVERWPID